MIDAMDMSTPVTRGELRAELAAAIAPLATKAELAPLATKAELAAAIAPLATKTELEHWGGALLARIESLERRFDGFERRFDGLEQRLHAELARHATAMCEMMSKQISVIDERYADLPPRVHRLETEAFGPTRR